MPQRVDHIAIIVRNIEQSLLFYRDMLHLHVERLEDFPSEEIRIAFLSMGDQGCQIELIEPLNDTSHLAKFLNKRGEGLHHICLEVQDVKASLAELKQNNVYTLDQEPRNAAEGDAIFIHPKETHGVLIELLEKK